MQRRLLSLALSVTLAVSLPGLPVFAAPEPMTLGAAIATLQAEGIIDKLPQADLRLDHTITRAEMAKVLGASLNLQKEADAARQAAPFPDTQDHWANGWIAVARQHGLFLGRDDGLFHPRDPVTYAEVLTVLLRVTGRGLHSQYNWPWGAISTAVEFGMIPPDMNIGGKMSEPATRADVFRLTAVAVGRVPLAGSLDTLLQSLGDRTPPTLTLVRVPSVTGDWRPIVTGHAGDAVAVEVNGTPAEILPDGTFSAQVDLLRGDNTVIFRAVDGAGNRTERAANILLQTVAKLEFKTPELETSVGQPFKPVLSRLDAQGQPAPADDVNWIFDSSALTRDHATGTFTASRAGEYTLRASIDGAEATARVIVAGDPARLEVTPAVSTVVAGGAPVPVAIRVLDAQGRLVTAAKSQVQLTAIPSQNAAFDLPMITTKGGVATAYLTAGQATGGLGIQAAILGVNKITSPVVPISVQTRRFSGIQLTTVPPNARPQADQPIAIVATAVDQVGMPIAVREDITIPVEFAGDDVLQIARSTAVIKAGTSSSDATGGNAGAITTGNSGKVSVKGYQSGMTVTPAPFVATSSGSTSVLDVKLVREAAAADKLSAALVAVTRRDALGNVVAGDSSPVILFSQSAGPSVSQVSDSGGVALFAVRSATPGRVEMAAGLPGRPELNSKPVTVAFTQASTSVRPVIRTSARMVTSGGTVTAYIALESGAGQVVANPGPALRFNVNAPGATLTTAELTIPTGATRSGDVVVNVPTAANMVTVGGSMVGGDTLTAATINVTPPPPVTPEPVPVGLNLAATASTSGRAPKAGEEARFIIRARDGVNQLPGSYAVGVKILVGGREVTGPIPNLTIKAGPRTIQPGDVVRTTGGEMEIWVRYTGVGALELQPVPAAAASAVPDQWGVTGPAEASTTFRATAGKLTYTAGPLDHMSVQVGPNLGDLFQGVIKAARGRFATVRLSPVDQYGNPAADNCLATLTQIRSAPDGALVLRSSGTDVAEQSQSIGASGYADFLIAATTDQEATSVWSPMIICGSTPLVTDKNVTVSATVHSAPTPTIEFVGGSATTPGALRGTDDGLDLRIGQLTGAPETAELLVYDGNVLLGRFGPVQARSSNQLLRTVHLPVSLFAGQTRSITLRVRIHSGADVSEESLPGYVYYTP